MCTYATVETSATNGAFEETRATVAAINPIVLAIRAISTNLASHWCWQSSAYLQKTQIIVTKFYSDNNIKK